MKPLFERSLEAISIDIRNVMTDFDFIQKEAERMISLGALRKSPLDTESQFVSLNPEHHLLQLQADACDHVLSVATRCSIIREKIQEEKRDFTDVETWVFEALAQVQKRLPSLLALCEKANNHLKQFDETSLSEADQHRIGTLHFEEFGNRLKKHQRILDKLAAAGYTMAAIENFSADVRRFGSTLRSNASFFAFKKGVIH